MQPHLFNDTTRPTCTSAALGDLGGALGAALLVSRRDGGGGRPDAASAAGCRRSLGEARPVPAGTAYQLRAKHGLGTGSGRLAGLPGARRGKCLNALPARRS